MAFASADALAHRLPQAPAFSRRAPHIAGASVSICRPSWCSNRDPATRGRPGPRRQSLACCFSHPAWIRNRTARCTPMPCSRAISACSSADVLNGVDARNFRVERFGPGRVDLFFVHAAGVEIADFLLVRSGAAFVFAAACSRIWCSSSRFLSASSLKRPQLGYAAGTGFFFSHSPLA